MDRPEFLTDEQLEFLQHLSESEVTNMFFAVPHILRHYPDLTPEQAQQALLYRFIQVPASENHELTQAV